MLPTESAVRDVLSKYQDPETGRSVAQLQQVHDLKLAEGRIAVALGLTTWSAPLWEQTRAELTGQLHERFPGVEVTVEVVPHDRPAEPMGEVGVRAKTVLAVGSGKGGVGKSSVAALVAIGLSRAGCKVGLMDADVYGPSIPHLLGISEVPEIIDERFEPIAAAGLKMHSMGLLVPPNSPVVWRAPMVTRHLELLLRATNWDDLDYLVVDMPPGTGDVPLSLAKWMPFSQAVVVCTPQDVALLDATKAIGMFRAVNLDVLGMVENMSFFLCPDCNSRHDIFGSGGAKRKAAEMGVPFLGEVPLDMQLRILADEGKIAAAYDHPPSRPYLEAICQTLVGNLAAAHRRKPVLPTLPVLG